MYFNVIYLFTYCFITFSLDFSTDPPVTPLLSPGFENNLKKTVINHKNTLPNNHFLYGKCKRWMRYSCAICGELCFLHMNLKIPTEEQLGQNLLRARVNLQESNTGTRARGDHLYSSAVTPLFIHPADLKLLTLDHQPHWEDDCVFQGSTCSDLISSAFCCGYKPSDGIDVKLKSAQLKIQCDNRSFLSLL